MSTITIATQINIETNGRRISVQPEIFNSASEGDSFNSGVYEAQLTASSVPIGGVTVPKFGLFTNLDETNFVELGYDNTGFVAVMKIPALASVIVSLDGVLSTPQIKADTATCLISYTITE